MLAALDGPGTIRHFWCTIPPAPRRGFNAFFPMPFRDAVRIEIVNGAACFRDGDTEFPTICGTGLEDYVGTAWGMGAHAAPYGGVPLDARAPSTGRGMTGLPDPCHASTSRTRPRISTASTANPSTRSKGRSARGNRKGTVVGPRTCGSGLLAVRTKRVAL